MNVAGSVALITGGASGLGEATARMLRAADAHVVIADLNEAAGAALAQQLGDRAEFIRADVTQSDDLAAAVGRAVERFGRLHILVNCAGIAPTSRTLSRSGPHDIELFRRVIAINLVGTFDAIRLAAAQMATNEPNDDGERGVIVNTASVAAFEGQIGQAAYSASKAGIAGLTLPVARDLASLGIRVFTIAPGVFETPMMAAFPDEVRESLAAHVPFPPRLGRPDEFAMLVRQVIDNPMLNGETIRLDGAIRMGPR